MCSLTRLGYLVRNQYICTFYAWNVELLQRFSRSGLFSNSEYINSFWEYYVWGTLHYCLNKYLASRVLYLHYFAYLIDCLWGSRKLLMQGVTFRRRELKLYSFICSHLNIHFNQAAYKWDWQRCYPEVNHVVLIADCILQRKGEQVR